MANGSAFNGNRMQSHQIRSTDPLQSFTKMIRLTDFCQLNFITKAIGYKIIRKKLVFAIRYRGQWWIAPNEKCIDVLKDYLGVDEIIFCQTN
jgi:hypothetical protein